MKQPCVYILASQYKGTLYTGVTTNLVQRVYQHKHKVYGGFTKKHNIDLLMYYEYHATVPSAIKREKQMKKWERQWKINLIIKENPKWLDLYDNLV